jgi:hydroxypyruvate reductase
MRPDVLLMLPIYAPAMAELEREFTVHKPWEAADRGAFVARVGPGIRAAITTTSKGFDSGDFEPLPNLELLACYGPYVNLLDLQTARQRRVSVSYTPDSTAEPVADLAMGLVVAVMRRLNEADRFVRAGRWPKEAFAAGRDVHHKTLGIVGFGRIGQELAARAAGFGMTVVYHGPRAKPDLPHAYEPDLEQLARRADCLAVTCALTDATRNLVDERILQALGPDGFLVNVARGAIVDEQALVDALAQGRIAGAGLDVFSDEPNVRAELLAMDNVVLAPHIGTSTRENREERMNKLMANLRAHFAGRPMPFAWAL